jgi:hypothetical protein
MHEPMEMGGTRPDARKEEGDADVATHEQMEWGGALSKRSSGTQRPFPPFHLDGQVISQLYDQHRCPHITVFLLLPHGGQYQVQFVASRF